MVNMTDATVHATPMKAENHAPEPIDLPLAEEPPHIEVIHNLTIEYAPGGGMLTKGLWLFCTCGLHRRINNFPITLDFINEVWDAHIEDLG